MISSTTTPSLSQVRWADVKDRVSHLRPGLAGAMAQLAEQGEWPLYRARYPFGVNFLQDGTFLVPGANKELVPITHPSIDARLKADLSYSSIPVGLILKNHAELYMLPEQRIVPFVILKPGNIFSLWETLDRDKTFHAPNIWHMSSGARSMFLLPKVADLSAFKKLYQAFGLKSIPRHLSDHALMFAEIAKHKDFICPWHSEVLYFSKPWLGEHKDNPAWIRFQYELLSYAWNATKFWRNRVIFDFIWDAFVAELYKRSYRPSSFVIDTVKHLIIIATGNLPGFIPAGDDDCAGPITAFRELMVNVYGLKHYTPTIMQPDYFSFSPDSSPVYYSLQMQTLLESSPKPKTVRSILAELCDIQYLMNLYLEQARADHLHIAGTPIESLVNQVEFDYFHSSIDKHQRIRLTQQMPEGDPRLRYPIIQPNNTQFPEISAFVRGCIRISRRLESLS